MKQKDIERGEAITRLKEWIKPGERLYTVLKHVSRSGMLRVIDVKKADGDSILHLGYNVAKAIGYSWDDKKDGMRVGGCGMDMGFSVVHSLSMTLYPEYQCTGAKCASADHVNMRDWEKKVPPYERDGKMMHKDGYAISQSWL